MADIQLDKIGLKSRVAEWIKAVKKHGFSRSELAKKWDISYTFVNGLSRETQSVGFKVIKYLLDTDYELNPRWLLFGEGEMYESERESNLLEEEKEEYVIKYGIELKILKEQLEKKDGQIAFLQKQIERLQEEQ